MVPRPLVTEWQLKIHSIPQANRPTIAVDESSEWQTKWLSKDVKSDASFSCQKSEIQYVYIYIYTYSSYLWRLNFFEDSWNKQLHPWESKLGTDGSANAARRLIASSKKPNGWTSGANGDMGKKSRKKTMEKIIKSDSTPRIHRNLLPKCLGFFWGEVSGLKNRLGKSSVQRKYLLKKSMVIIMWRTHSPVQFLLRFRTWSSAVCPLAAVEATAEPWSKKHTAGPPAGSELCSKAPVLTEVVASAILTDGSH